MFLQAKENLAKNFSPVKQMQAFLKILRIEFIKETTEVKKINVQL